MKQAGYDINDLMPPDDRLVFSGPGIESGQIAVLQTKDVEEYVIQIDVTQNAHSYDVSTDEAQGANRNRSLY